MVHELPLFRGSNLVKHVKPQRSNGSVLPGMYVAFVSHQWLGKNHCDAFGDHSCTLREMLRELLHNKLRIEPLGESADGLLPPAPNWGPGIFVLTFESGLRTNLFQNFQHGA